MKKILLFFIGLFCFTLNVYASNNIYSINQYSNEEFLYLIKSYDNKQEYDGHVVAGTFLKKEKNDDSEEIEHTQVMIVKYEKNGNVDWNYHYGKTGEDSIYGLVHSYDEEKKINGYVAVVSETKEKNEENSDSIIYVVLDLNGKLVQEIAANYQGTITNIIELYDENHLFSGYLLLGYKNNHVPFIMEYDYNLQLVWDREYPDYYQFDEIVSVDQSFIVLSSRKENDQSKYQLLQFNEDKNLSLIKENFEEDDIPHLLSLGDSYLLYGFTKEVKFSKKDAFGYYINKYHNNHEIEWDLVGNIEVNHNQVLQLQPIYQDNELIEYHLLYINDNDSSIEVVKIGLDGTIQNKIKKIKNDYYHINSFLSEGKTITFIGQINCPEDDNCEYDTNSLYLVSNEDKVIEVKDNDSKKILIGFGFLLLIIVGLLLVRKKQK